MNLQNGFSDKFYSHHFFHHDQVLNILCPHCWNVFLTHLSHSFSSTVIHCQYSLYHLYNGISFLETYKGSSFLIYKLESNTFDGIKSPPQSSSHLMCPASSRNSWMKYWAASRQENRNLSRSLDRGNLEWELDMLEAPQKQKGNIEVLQRL